MKDVFISYAKADGEIARELCRLLESNGVSCWIAPRDIPPGRTWDETILDAIDECRIVMLVLSARASGSKYVKAEVNRAFSRGKSILTLRVEDVAPPKSLALYTDCAQWCDGFPPPLSQHAGRLSAAVKDLLGRKDESGPIVDGPVREHVIPEEEDMMILSGRVHAGVNDEGWQLFDGLGERPCERRVDFPQSFREPPKVVLSISGLDADKSANLRIEVTAPQVDRNGFTVHLRTWWDSKVYGVWVDWVAYGA